MHDPSAKNPPYEQGVSHIERQTYTIPEAAKILGICRSVAYRRGVLPTVAVGGRRLVPKRAIDRMLADTAGTSVRQEDV
jgi:excisionase family DNA binding protein